MQGVRGGDRSSLCRPTTHGLRIELLEARDGRRLSGALDDAREARLRCLPLGARLLLRLCHPRALRCALLLLGLRRRARVRRLAARGAHRVRRVLERRFHALDVDEEALALGLGGLETRGELGPAAAGGGGKAQHRRRGVGGRSVAGPRVPTAAPAARAGPPRACSSPSDKRFGRHVRGRGSPPRSGAALEVVRYAALGGGPVGGGGGGRSHPQQLRGPLERRATVRLLQRLMLLLVWLHGRRGGCSRRPRSRSRVRAGGHSSKRRLRVLTLWGG